MTPIARPDIGVSKYGHIKNAAPIKAKFNKTGDIAGTVKCLKEFNIPIDRAVSEIKNI